MVLTTAKKFALLYFFLFDGFVSRMFTVTVNSYIDVTLLPIVKSHLDILFQKQEKSKNQFSCPDRTKNYGSWSWRPKSYGSGSDAGSGSGSGSGTLFFKN
jgi:hypothetical protein